MDINVPTIQEDGDKYKFYTHEIWKRRMNIYFHIRTRNEYSQHPDPKKAQSARFIR